MVTHLPDPRHLVLLAAADTAGALFFAQGKTKLLVRHAAGSNITIEAQAPIPYTVWAGWSNNPFVTDDELVRSVETLGAVTKIIVPPAPFAGDDQRLAFGVPRTQEITAIADAVGAAQFANFTKSTNLISKDSVALDVWYSNNALAVAETMGQGWTITTDFAGTWIDVTQSLIGAANISAHGQYGFEGAPGTLYRITPVAAGSQVWKVA